MKKIVLISGLALSLSSLSWAYADSPIPNTCSKDPNHSEVWLCHQDDTIIPNITEKPIPDFLPSGYEENGYRYICDSDPQEFVYYSDIGGKRVYICK